MDGAIALDHVRLFLEAVPPFEALDDNLVLLIASCCDPATALSLVQLNRDTHRVVRPHLESRLVRLVETGRLSAGEIDALDGLRPWLQHVVRTQDALCTIWHGGVQPIGRSDCALLACDREASVDGRRSARVVGADETDCELVMPIAAAAHGPLLLVADHVTHRVCVYRDGRLLRALTHGSMKQPVAIATEGRRAFVGAADGVHVFDVQSAAHLRSWPTVSADGVPFSCDRGLALSRGEVFVTDRRGARVHVFDESGAHLRWWGGRGRGAGEFLQPHGCVAVRDHLFVSEQAGKRIQAFTRTGEFVGVLSPPRCGDLGAISADEHAMGATLFVTDLDQRCARIVEIEPW